MIPTDPDPGERPDPDPHPEYIVPGLSRGIDLLELMAREERPMGFSEIAERMGLARSSVFRLLYTLERRGLVEADGVRRTYSLGSGVLRLGYNYLVGQDVVQIARPELEALAASTGVSAHLAIRSERDIVHLLHVPGTSGFISNISAGMRLPAHATPMGQILLSKLSRKELFQLYEGAALPALTPQTPTTLPELATAVSRAAADGVVISHGSVEAGGISLAAPVTDASGDIVAAIDISCPESAFVLSELETRYRTEVLRAAERISRRLVPR